MKTSAIRFRLIAIGALFIAAVVIGYFIIRPSNELPIYNPSQLDPRLVGDEAKGDTGVHHILPFHLIDQDGGQCLLADVKGKVVLADFFFTTCGSICPKMSTQLIRVQEKYKDEDRLILLSHSVTPETDSVPVLKAYAEKYGVYHKRWRLMTGSREQIYRLARNSYFAAVDEGDGGPDDFVHTEKLRAGRSARQDPRLLRRDQARTSGSGDEGISGSCWTGCPREEEAAGSDFKF